MWINKLALIPIDSFLLAIVSNGLYWGWSFVDHAVQPKRLNVELRSPPEKSRRMFKFVIKFKLFKLETDLQIYNWNDLLEHVLTGLVRQLRRFVGLVLAHLLSRCCKLETVVRNMFTVLSNSDFSLKISSENCDLSPSTTMPFTNSL